MTMIVDRMADEFAAAYRQGPGEVARVTARYLAAEVEIVHVPAQPVDGIYAKELILAALSDRVSQFARVMPDFREDGKVSAQEDQIVVELNVSGTLSDGTPISITGTDRLIVNSQQIVTLVQDFEPTQMDVLVAALSAPL